MLAIATSRARTAVRSRGEQITAMAMGLSAPNRAYVSPPERSWLGRRLGESLGQRVQMRFQLSRVGRCRCHFEKCAVFLHGLGHAPYLFQASAKREVEGRLARRQRDRLLKLGDGAMVVPLLLDGERQVVLRGVVGGRQPHGLAILGD